MQRIQLFRTHRAILSSMKIDGKAIAEGILTELAIEVKKLGKIPTLAVILVGDNPASVAYINQKQKAAARIGATLVLSRDIGDVKKFDEDPAIAGLIIQRPIPEEFSGITPVNSKKDVDGFLPDSPFTPPVALAVEKILQSTGVDWKKKRTVVIGRGETAGKPIANYLKNVTVIHSKTEHPQVLIEQADVIISCVGKERVVTDIKPGAILIGVGIWRDSEGKLRGDYNEEEIKDVAAYYTPTPGGVGPVNVACLMQNLVLAAQKSH